VDNADDSGAIKIAGVKRNSLRISGCH